MMTSEVIINLNVLGALMANQVMSHLDSTDVRQ